MASAFITGCGVAVGCWTLRAGLQAAKHVKVPNMPNMPNMGGAAPNWNAAAAATQQLFQDAVSRVAGAHPGGFEKTMSRREAALILGVKCVRAPPCRSAVPRVRPPRAPHPSGPVATDGCARAPPQRLAGRAQRAPS